ncbi:MAG: gas vesicle protein K [Pikeienuella sp.]
MTAPRAPSASADDLAALAGARVADLIARHADGKGRLALDPDRVQEDLARLVLGLMELLRELMELQAIRRLEAGSLTDDEEFRVSEGLFRARGAIRRVAAEFGIGEDELTLSFCPAVEAL